MDLMNIVKNIEWFKNTQDVITEEATKLHLIYPFLIYLGYDIYSPMETKYEFECDMHEQGSRRVDCAILDNDAKPLIIVEAKAFGKNLNDFLGQVRSYFVSSGAKYAFLTDGNKYMIYDKAQVDGDFYLALPKYMFSIDTIDEAATDIIRKFAKINTKQLLILKEKMKEENNALEVFEETEDEKTVEVCSDKDILESFLVNNSAIEGKSVDSVYNKYNEYVVGKKRNPFSIGKFEGFVKEKLSMKSSYSGGVKYFVRENTSGLIVEKFIRTIEFKELHDTVCDEVYKCFKDYCNEQDCFVVSRKVFCREVVMANQNIKVVTKKMNGIMVDYFNNNTVLIEEINQAGIAISDEEKGYLQYCNSIDVTQIVNRINQDVYQDYCSYCESNIYPVMSIIAWSRKIKKTFGVEIKSKNINGKTKRVFIK